MSQNHQTSVQPAKADIGLVEFVALMALMTSLVALSIDAMLPALHQIGTDLAIADAQQTHLIVSLFFLGMAFGQLYYGPLSDDKGRRYAILHGLIIFAVGTVVCMFSESLVVMLIGRVIQAFGVSGPRIATLAVIRDKYEGEAMARVMSFIMMVFILVPMIAPSFGQAILSGLSWRHIFSSFLIIGTIIGVWFFIRQPETLPKSMREPFSWGKLWQSSKFILTHKLVMFYTISSGIIFGAFLAYISASQTLFQQIYDTGEQFPLYFALLSFSIGLASFTNGTLVMRLGMRKLCTWAMLGWMLFSTILVVLCLNYEGVPPLWQFVSVLFCAFFSIGIVFGNVNSMAMQPLGKMAGLGAAIIGSLSSVFSVATAIFVGSFIHLTITPVALGFVAFGGISFILYWYADK
ncbi:multidrug effflux MFS transporter [Paraglaciecola aquimarina]|uniref:Bcr/CflA family efflux transporter n=1 Tax=Paraglaciecola aquimarina TaxID=1235557 RepID=A0ABU3STH5_9ALTE|nr:multidrug effflux MFS transporter [Paraglaciecola aquimarina]MDU0353308.1 multidrug effflux MFS transporter [Paraglaciecola aquimarina]